MKKKTLLLFLISSLTYAQDHPNLSCTIRIESSENYTSKTLDIPTDGDISDKIYELGQDNTVMKLKFNEDNQNIFHIFFGHGENEQELGSGFYDLRDADAEGRLVKFTSSVKGVHHSLECIYLKEEIEQIIVDDVEDANYQSGIISDQQLQLIKLVLEKRIKNVEFYLIPSLKTALSYHKRLDKKWLKAPISKMHALKAPLIAMGTSVAVDIGIHEIQSLSIGEDPVTNTLTALTFGGSIIWGIVRYFRYKKTKPHG